MNGYDSCKLALPLTGPVRSNAGRQLGDLQREDVGCQDSQRWNGTAFKHRAMALYVSRAFVCLVSVSSVSISSIMCVTSLLWPDKSK